MEYRPQVGCILFGEHNRCECARSQLGRDSLRTDWPNNLTEHVLTHKDNVEGTWGAHGGASRLLSAGFMRKTWMRRSCGMTSSQRSSTMNVFLVRNSRAVSLVQTDCRS